MSKFLMIDKYIQLKVHSVHLGAPLFQLRQWCYFFFVAIILRTLILNWSSEWSRSRFKHFIVIIFIIIISMFLNATSLSFVIFSSNVNDRSIKKYINIINIIQSDNHINHVIKFYFRTFFFWKVIFVSKN